MAGGGNGARTLATTGTASRECFAGGRDADDRGSDPDSRAAGPAPTPSGAPPVTSRSSSRGTRARCGGPAHLRAPELPDYPRHPRAVVAIVGSVLSVGVPVAGAALMLLAFVSTSATSPASFYLAAASPADAPRRTWSHARRERQARHAGARRSLRRGAHRRGVRRARDRAPCGARQAAAPADRPLGTVRLVDGRRARGRAASNDRDRGARLTVVQFIFTVVLIVAVPLLADIALSGAVPGATTTPPASPPCCVSPSATAASSSTSTSGCCSPARRSPCFLGMRSFLKVAQAELPADRTVFVNIDQVGPGPGALGLEGGQRPHLQVPPQPAAHLRGDCRGRRGRPLRRPRLRLAQRRRRLTRPAPPATRPSRSRR